LLDKTRNLLHVLSRSTSQTPHRGVCFAQDDAGRNKQSKENFVFSSGEFSPSTANFAFSSGEGGGVADG
jgi:hypothetical protein